MPPQSPAQLGCNGHYVLRSDSVDESADAFPHFGKDVTSVVDRDAGTVTFYYSTDVTDVVETWEIVDEQFVQW